MNIKFELNKINQLKYIIIIIFCLVKKEFITHYLFNLNNNRIYRNLLLL